MAEKRTFTVVLVKYRTGKGAAKVHAPKAGKGGRYRISRGKDGAWGAVEGAARKAARRQMLKLGTRSLRLRLREITKDAALVPGSERREYEYVAKMAPLKSPRVRVITERGVSFVSRQKFKEGRKDGKFRGEKIASWKLVRSELVVRRA